jgi:sigma54-dependent transcription regulator
LDALPGSDEIRVADHNWRGAKKEMIAILTARAKLRGMIPYGELVRQVKRIRLEPDSHALHALAAMLGEISEEEDAADRGMLTVIVVHKHGDMQPGPGFFDLAQHLGRDTSDILKCWVDELKKVHAHWSR